MWGHRAERAVTAQAAASAPAAAPQTTAATPPPCATPKVGPGDAVLERLIAQWTRVHPDTGVAVWQSGSSCPLSIVAHKATVGFLPASNNKLMTSAGALLTLGPAFRYTTRLVTSGKTTITHHTVHGAVTLIGSGDPLFSTLAYARVYLGSKADTLDALAAQLKRADGTRPAITKITDGVRANASVFDARTLPPYWNRGDIGSIEPLSGMATDEDFAGLAQATTLTAPMLAATQRLRTALRQQKITVTGPIGAARVPAAPITLAEVTSPRLSTILRIMNVPSDDFIAEQLVKTIGAQAHTPGTSATGVDRVVAKLRALGVLQPADRIVDGSGLARTDRLTPDTLVRLLLDAQRDPSWGKPLIASLPAPGQGTLKGRLSGLTGRVRAKTGTLDDVSSLSGVVHAVDGKTYDFSILTNRLSLDDIAAARAFQDAIVRRLAHGVAS